MSMPTFPECGIDISQEQAFNMLLGSIAMEELGLSHILNAEGEKLQYVLGTLPGSKGLCPTTGEILEVNRSVSQLLEQVSHNQLLLKSKLEHLLLAKERWSHCPPPPAPTPPCPRPVCLFCGSTDKVWRAGQGLCWKPCFTQGEVCCRQGCCPSSVYPPPQCAVMLHYCFALCIKSAGKVRITLDRVEQNCLETLLCCEAAVQPAGGTTYLSGSIALPPEVCPAPLQFTLREPEQAEVLRATLTLSAL